VSSNEIFVLGGGVIGLSIASALLASGQRVRLFDAGTEIRATSDAAAGMLAPSFEKMNRNFQQSLKLLLVAQLTSGKMVSLVFMPTKKGSLQKPRFWRLNRNYLKIAAAGILLRVKARLTRVG